MKLEIDVGEKPLDVTMIKDGEDVLVRVNETVLLRIKGIFGEVWLRKNENVWKRYGFKTQKNGAVSISYY